MASVVIQPSTPLPSLESMTAWGAMILALGGAITLLYKLLTWTLSRDIRDNAKSIVDQRHLIKNQTARVDELERFRGNDVERIVRLETNFVALEKGQARIELTLEKMDRDAQAGRSEIIDSLRELRESRLKP